MANEYLEIELDGDDAALLFLRTIETRLKLAVKNFPAGAANYGLYWLRLYVPIGRTGYLIRHTDATGSHWRPGGRGGGGEYEAIVGVKRGDSKHPLYVHGGTGIYAGRGVITATGMPRPMFEEMYDENFAWPKGGKRMRFVGHRDGKVVWTYFTRGQRANPFMYATYQQVKLYFNARIHTLGPELVN